MSILVPQLPRNSLRALRLLEVVSCRRNHSTPRRPRNTPDGRIQQSDQHRRQPQSQLLPDATVTSNQVDDGQFGRMEARGHLIEHCGLQMPWRQSDSSRVDWLVVLPDLATQHDVHATLDFKLVRALISASERLRTRLGVPACYLNVHY